MPLYLVYFEGTKLFCLYEAQLRWYLSAKAIQVSCAKMPFSLQLQANVKSLPVPQLFLNTPLQKNKCLSKLSLPPPREKVARGKVRA